MTNSTNSAEKALLMARNSTQNTLKVVNAAILALANAKKVAVNTPRNNTVIQIVKNNSALQRAANNTARATANAQRNAVNAARATANAQKKANNAVKMAKIQAAVNKALAERKLVNQKLANQKLVQQRVIKNTTRKNHGKSVGNSRRALAKAFGWNIPK